MTWAYQANASHSDFSRYNKNQMTMYNAIVSAVQEKILTNTSIDGILPSGTAIQNLRTSYIGDTLTRDGYHLSNDIGRYTAALLWYRVLMGADLTDLTTVPASYPGIAQHLPAIKEAVDNAAKTPFVVTEATVTGPVGSEVLESLLEMTEDDAAYLEKRGLNPDDYEVLDLRLTFWAYYYSTNQATAKLLPNEGNSSQYFATGLFTPQTLPVGSIIRVKEGYKYRLEGWQKTGTKNSLTRLNNSTADMVIDASLYTKYNFVAFNVSHASGGGTVDYADAWGFRIYTPKQKAPDLSMTEADRAYLEDLGLDPDNFEKLDLDYTQFAYYLSTDASAGTVYSAESRTDNNLINFLATRLISKEEMPVGSVIRVDSGYQFRPERFVTPEVAADKRGDNTFVGCIVDEAWWGNYQHVGFNISIKGASTTFVATPETGTHFVIYVPKA